MFAKQLTIIPMYEDVPDPFTLNEYIYFVYSRETGKVKIGRTNNLDNRLSVMSTDSPTPLDIIMSISIPVDAVKDIERTIHGDFVDCHADGEWFNVDVESVRQYINNSGLLEAKSLSDFMVWSHRRQMIWWRDIDKPTRDYEVFVYVWIRATCPRGVNDGYRCIN